MSKGRAAALVAVVAVTAFAQGAKASGPYVRVGTQSIGSVSFDGTTDLDGDHLGDFLVKDAYAHTVSFRRGVDGHQLWSMSLADSQRVFALRLGSPARPAILTKSTGSALTLTAYDGRTGTRLWRWSGPATFSHFLTSGSGRAARFLLRQAAGPGGKLTQALVVSGSSGTVVRVGAPGQWHLIALGDVNADGFSDVGLLDHTRLIARSSSSGAELWHQMALLADPSAYRAGPDLTGDHRAETFVNGAAKARVLDGLTGAELWQTGNLDLQPIGDVNKDGLPDVVGITPGYGCNTHVTAFVGGTGARIWSRTVAKITPIPGVTSCLVFVYSAGDVQRDGVADLFVADESAGDGTGILDGRTGRWLWNRPYDSNHTEYPLKLSVDGDGPDLWGQLGDSGYNLTIFDGRTNRVVFSMDVHGWNSPAQYTADGHADFLLQSGIGDSAPVTVSLFDGATQTTGWSITV